MEALSLAIVDDDVEFATMMAALAARRGFDTKVIHSVEEAGSWLSRNDPCLTLLDVNLPDGSGFDVLDRIPGDHNGSIYFVSGDSGTQHAGRVAGSEADGFLSKPIAPERFGRLLEACRGHEGAFGLIGGSQAIRDVIEIIRQVAPYDCNVLVTGETGTGKELVARALHQASGRSGRFVAVNCGAIPAELLASQLFGHERGSFTGANSRHAGYFEQAHNGTLFLDEIGEMPPSLQAYLLRVLESGMITRVGGSGEIPVSVRVLAATHRLAGSGMRDSQPQLRPDLYYRLARCNVHLPPLRERQEDVAPLARFFLDRLNRHYGTQRAFAPHALDRLAAHDWPGNVRELAGAVERAYIAARNDRLEPRPVLPSPMIDSDKAGAITFQVGMTFQQVQEMMLDRTLAFYGGDKTAAARSLGVSVRTVHNHLSRR